MMKIVVWSHPTFTPKKRYVLVGRYEGNVGRRWEPDLPEAEHDQDDPDGRRDLERVAHVRQQEGQSLERQAHSRADDQETHGHRQRPRPTVLDVEEVEDEGRQSGDRSLGEVEDARGLVGQHQTRGGESVDRARDDPDHDEWQKIAHSAAPSHGLLTGAPGV